MLPKNEKTKIAILDLVRYMKNQSHWTLIYSRFKDDYPRLNFRNRREWEIIFQELISEKMIIQNEQGYYLVSDIGIDYLEKSKRPQFTSVQIGSITDSNLQIGNTNQMFVTNFINVLQELEKKVSGDENISAKDKTGILENIKTGISVLDILCKIPAAAKHIEDILKNIPQC